MEARAQMGCGTLPPRGEKAATPYAYTRRRLPWTDVGARATLHLQSPRAQARKSRGATPHLANARSRPSTKRGDRKGVHFAKVTTCKPGAKMLRAHPCGHGARPTPWLPLIGTRLLTRHLRREIFGPETMRTGPLHEHDDRHRQAQKKRCGLAPKHAKAPCKMSLRGGRWLRGDN